MIFIYSIIYYLAFNM